MRKPILEGRSKMIEDLSKKKLFTMEDYLNWYLLMERWPSPLRWKKDYSSASDFDELTDMLSKYMPIWKYIISGLEGDKQLKFFGITYDNLKGLLSIQTATASKKKLSESLQEIEKLEPTDNKETRVYPSETKKRIIDFRRIFQSVEFYDVLIEKLSQSMFVQIDSNKNILAWTPPSKGNNTKDKYLIVLFRLLEDKNWLDKSKLPITSKQKVEILNNWLGRTGFSISAKTFGKHYKRNDEDILEIIEDYHFI